MHGISPCMPSPPTPAPPPAPSALDAEAALGAAVALVEPEDAKGLRILSDVSDATANPELAPAFRELAAEAEAILAEEQAEEAAYLDG